ncbi:hypothetical protein BDP27DRAFT_1441497 [Rhodocollybia butyracea]|uniref:Uncharacterized protein n=1 Tax=Rhodocollybia butyracea TaxID=206335 RepID=A0A9P5UGZ3_9AGAR|nr:hypothetical protein BDP27DRAFT_1441497 [Rhodocollybia butyracea]
MRFITFVVTALVGCFLSTGICVAKPISARGGTSQEITAVVDSAPPHQLSWLPSSSGSPMKGEIAALVKNEAIHFVQRFSLRHFGPHRAKLSFFDGGGPAVSKYSKVRSELKTVGAISHENHMEEPLYQENEIGIFHLGRKVSK